jgi:hypothetical protein
MIGEKIWRKYTQDGFFSLVKSSVPYARRESRRVILREYKRKRGKILAELDGEEYIAVRGDGLGTMLGYYNPQVFVEIGVGKRDGLKSYLNNCKSKQNNEQLEYYGFDTFGDGLPSLSEADETETRTEQHKLNLHNTSKVEIEQIVKNHETPCSTTLIKGNTNNTLPEYSDQLPDVDLVYVDGGHSYETTKEDYHNIRPALSSGSVIIFDDFNCQDGKTEFINELLRHYGARNDNSVDDEEFRNITFSPAVASDNNECIYVLFTLY